MRAAGMALAYSGTKYRTAGSSARGSAPSRGEKAQANGARVPRRWLPFADSAPLAWAARYSSGNTSVRRAKATAAPKLASATAKA